MMRIESPNCVIENTIINYLARNLTEITHFNDFDDVKYTIQGDSSHNQLLFGFSSLASKQILQNGGLDMIQQEYKEFYIPNGPKIEGHDITLVVDLAKLPITKPKPENPDEETLNQWKEQNKQLKKERERISKIIGKQLSIFKAAFFASPIKKACIELAKKGSVGSDFDCEIPYRQSEKYWVCTTANNLNVVIGMNFPDPTDQGLARIILWEFTEVKRHLKTLKNPPEIAYHDLNLPDTLRKYNVQMKDYSNGFITFGIGDSNVKKEIPKLVDFIIGFRDYIQYHLTAMKTYLHMRMRKKVNEFVRVIKETKRDQEETGKKYKSLIGGPTIEKEPEENKKGSSPKKVFQYH